MKEGELLLWRLKRQLLLQLTARTQSLPFKDAEGLERSALKQGSERLNCTQSVRGKGDFAWGSYNEL